MKKVEKCLVFFEMKKKFTGLSNNESVVGLCADMYDGGFDYWIGCMSDKECPKDYEEMIIPALTWAVFEIIGPMRSLPNAMQDIWKPYLFRMVTKFGV